MQSYNKVGRFIALTGLLIYSVWIAGHLFNPNLSFSQSYVSELDVNGQPHAWLFRLANLVGATLLALSFGFFLRLNKQHKEGRYLTFNRLLYIATLAAVINAFYPMDCSASQSRACFLQQQAYSFSFSQWIHLLTSIVMFGSLIYAQYYSTFFMIKSDIKGFWFRISLSNLIVQITLNIVLGVVSYTGYGPIGLLQRLSLLLFEVWIIFVLFYKKLNLLPV